MSNLLQRTLSGTVYVALVVASILLHPALWGVLFLMVTTLAVREYHTIIQSAAYQRITAMVGGATLFVLIWTSTFYPDLLPLWLAIGIYGMIVTAVLVTELFAKQANPISNWGHFLVGQIMFALPLALMSPILQQSKYYLLALFITMWVNDSGAYIVGVSTAHLPCGNHKMFPRVSPAKSWEGLVGGIVFALAAGYVFYHVGWFSMLSHALLFTGITAIVGTLGDLMESLLKRTIGIKDSGRFLPGHGGVLDRFDSLILATPVILFLILCFTA